jgi:hypothetical protein
MMSRVVVTGVMVADAAWEQVQPDRESLGGELLLFAYCSLHSQCACERVLV